MSEVTDARYTLTRMILRRYYNACVNVINSEDEGLISEEEAEKHFMQLDDRFTEEILAALELK